MPKTYATDKIRNIALLGHSGSGKTSLAEAMLFNAGVTTRMGRPEEGNTISDHDEEEIRRQISIYSEVVPIEWKDHKINVIDTPGYLDFIGEVISSLSVADVAVLVVDGVSGVEVGTILAWQNAVKMGIPRVVFVNKMERDNASYRRIINELRERFDDAKFVPMEVPIRNGEHFEGLVDLITQKARTGVDHAPAEIPADMADEVAEFRLEMVETSAEGDDELMMKYFDDEELTEDEISFGLRSGLNTGKLVPVFCGSAQENVGVRSFMNSIISTLPAPKVSRPVLDTSSGEQTQLEPDADGPLVAQVFKTIDDQYGSVSYFKVLSGKLSSDTRVVNINEEEEERLGQLFWPRGKEHISVDALVAGDIGGAVKLAHTKTGDILADKGCIYKGILPEYPNPLYAVALHPKTQSDAGKMGAIVHRLTLSDPTLNTRYEEKTRQNLLEGMGDTHIDVAVNRMAHYGLNVDVSVPKVPYLETVTKIASSRYRHKKQTGGAGQFAEVELRVEPMERGEGFSFSSEVFGGAISSTFLPSIEKGVKQVMDNGVLSGYPVVDVKAVVVDGKEHPVDSKDIAFQIAGREVFKEAFVAANGALLEPIMELTVTVPETYTGDVMGDLTTKRGQVQGMEQLRGDTMITALVPLAEVQRYATDLRSLTQGRGVYAQKLSHYQPVPSHIATQVIEAHKVEDED